MLTDTLKNSLIDKVQATNKVDKIILFGSQATRTAGSDSDIDLLVVLDDNTMPKNFHDRNNNYLQISRAIREIEKQYPVDLLVYTRPEFELMKEKNSQFFRRVLREGIELI